MVGARPSGLLHDHAEQLVQLLEVDAAVGSPKDTLDIAGLDEATRQFAARSAETVERRSDRRNAERRQVNRRRRRRELGLGRLNERSDLGAVASGERHETLLVGTHDLFETFGHVRAASSTLEEHGPQAVGVALGVAEPVLEDVVADDARADDEQRLTNGAGQVHDLSDTVASQVQQQAQSRQLNATGEVDFAPPVEHRDGADLAGLAERSDILQSLELVDGIGHQVLEALDSRAREVHCGCLRSLH